jgi:hypothetical protein
VSRGCRSVPDLVYDRVPTLSGGLSITTKKSPLARLSAGL